MSKLIEKYNNSPFSSIRNRIYTEGTIGTIADNNAGKNVPVSAEKSDLLKKFLNDSVVVLQQYGTVLSQYSNYGVIKVNPANSLQELFTKASIQAPIPISKDSVLYDYKKSSISGTVPSFVNFFEDTFAKGFTPEMQKGKTQFIIQNIPATSPMPQTPQKTGVITSPMKETDAKLGRDYSPMTPTPEKSGKDYVPMAQTPEKTIQNIIDIVSTPEKKGVDVPLISSTPEKTTIDIVPMKDTVEKPVQITGLMKEDVKQGRDYSPMPDTPEKTIQEIKNAKETPEKKSEGYSPLTETPEKKSEGYSPMDETPEKKGVNVPVMPNTPEKPIQTPGVMIDIPKEGRDVPLMPATPEKPIQTPGIMVDIPKEGRDVPPMPQTPEKTIATLGIMNSFSDIDATGFNIGAQQGTTFFNMKNIAVISPMPQTPEKPVQTPGIIIDVPKEGRDVPLMPATPEKPIATLGIMNVFSDINAVGFTPNFIFGDTKYKLDTIPGIVLMPPTPDKPIATLGIVNDFADIDASGFTLNAQQGNTLFNMKNIAITRPMPQTPSKPIATLGIVNDFEDIDATGFNIGAQQGTTFFNMKNIAITRPMPQTPEKPIQTPGVMVDIPKEGRDVPPIPETPEKTKAKLGATDFIYDVKGYTQGFNLDAQKNISLFKNVEDVNSATSPYKSDKYPYNIDENKAGKLGPTNVIYEFEYNKKKYTQGFNLDARPYQTFFDLDVIQSSDYDKIKIRPFPVVDIPYYSKYFLENASDKYVVDLEVARIDNVYDVEKLKTIKNSKNTENVYTIKDDMKIISDVSVIKKRDDGRFGFVIGSGQFDTHYVGEDSLPTANLKSFTFPARVGVMAQYPIYMGEKTLDNLLGGVFKPFGIDTGMTATGILDMAADIFGLGSTAQTLVNKNDANPDAYNPFYTPKLLPSKYSDSSRALNSVGQLGWTAAVNVTTTLFNGLFKKATGQLEDLFDKAVKGELSKAKEALSSTFKSVVSSGDIEQIIPEIPGVTDFTSYNPSNITKKWFSGVDLETVGQFLQTGEAGVIDANKDIISQFTAGNNPYNEKSYESRKIADDKTANESTTFTPDVLKNNTNSIELNKSVNISDIVEKFDVNTLSKDGMVSLYKKEEIKDVPAGDPSTKVGGQTYSEKLRESRKSGNSSNADYKSYKPLIDKGFTEYMNKNISDPNNLEHKPFNSIIDSIGTQELFETTEAYDSPDFINFYFEDISSESNKNSSIVIPFRAILTSFTDGVTSTLEGNRYMGRPDQLYKYQGFDRKVDLSFDIGINSRQELLPTWRKLNYLYGMCYPVNYGVSVAMKPPIMRLTVGTLLQRVYVLMNNISFTLDNTKTVWETERNYQLPMFMSVSTSLIVVYDDTPFARSKHFAQDTDWMQVIIENPKTKELTTKDANKKEILVDTTGKLKQ